MKSKKFHARKIQINKTLKLKDRPLNILFFNGILNFSHDLLMNRFVPKIGKYAHYNTEISDRNGFKSASVWMHFNTNTNNADLFCIANWYRKDYPYKSNKYNPRYFKFRISYGKKYNLSKAVICDTWKYNEFHNPLNIKPGHMAYSATAGTISLTFDEFKAFAENRKRIRIRVSVHPSTMEKTQRSRYQTIFNYLY